MALATGSVLLNLPEAQELVAKGGRLLQEGLVRLPKRGEAPCVAVPAVALVLSSLVSSLASAQTKVSPAFAEVGGEFLLGSASLSWTSSPAATPEPG